MNRARWRNCRSASRLVAKLAEETGEVAKAYLDVLDCSNDGSRAAAKRKMLVEIDHVKFIASCLDTLVDDSTGAPIGAVEEDEDGA